jgi:hypothetical protein
LLNECVSWCALGSLIVTERTKVGLETFYYDNLPCERSKPETNKAYWALYDAARALFNNKGVEEINDEYGHEAVLKVYDKAINIEALRDD